MRNKGLLGDIAYDMGVRFIFLLDNVVPANVKASTAGSSNLSA